MDRAASGIRIGFFQINILTEVLFDRKDILKFVLEFFLPD
jgi:hypothetical protein